MEVFEMAKKVILVIDDSTVHLEIVNNILSDEYEIIAVMSGHHALEALQTVRPDLILLDIEMPELTGFEVKERLNLDNKLADIPVFFVTAHAPKEFVSRSIKLGAKGFIVKPCEPDILKRQVKKVLGLHSSDLQHAKKELDPTLVTLCESLRMACQRQDFSAALDQSITLDGLNFSPDIQEKVNDISMSAKMMDYGSAVRLIDEMLN
jgi:CheY-like chemotaxis protein